jgi:hypothetical protein
MRCRRVSAQSVAVRSGYLPGRCKAPEGACEGLGDGRNRLADQHPFQVVGNQCDACANECAERDRVLAAARHAIVNQASSRDDVREGRTRNNRDARASLRSTRRGKGDRSR